MMESILATRTQLFFGLRLPGSGKTAPSVLLEKETALLGFKEIEGNRSL